LLSDEGDKAVLMDFGSLMRARTKITNRLQALAQQDLAAQHSTMPYRAPELFDVKTNTELDEKVDIWVGDGVLIVATRL
jgi:serine/threonine kinase 16